MQEAKMEELRRFQEIVESVEDMIYELDENGKFCYANKAMEKFSGFSREELKSIFWSDLIREDYRQPLVNYFRHQLKTRSPHSYREFPMVNRSGNEIWIGQNTKYIFEGKWVVSVRAIARDITLRKEVEIKLEHYQLSLELLNRIASEQNVSTDKLIKNALAVASKYLRLPLGILSKVENNVFSIQHHVTNGKNFPYQGQEFPLSQMFCDITLKKNDVIAISNMGASEYASHESYKTYKLEAYLGIPIMVNNECYGTVSFASSEIREKGFSRNDIEFIRLLSRWINLGFERKEAQEKLLLAREKAEAASLAKGEFLSVMSHEIRTPLNAVIGMSHLLMQSESLPHQHKYLKALRFSAENLLSLVNDVLDYSKIEANKIIFEELDFSLKDLAIGIKESLSVKAEEKNIGLKLMFDIDLPEVVKGDPARLTQILNNLIGNAIKFTEKGSVKLTVKLIEEEQEHLQIEFAVEDTGIGIPREKQPLIFDKFSQAESDTTRRFGGTGLGLSISKRLLELQGSKIMLESEEGKGSKFYFLLRLAKSQKNSTELENLRSTAVLNELLKGSRILLVEDNEVNQFIALEFLKAWGVEVDTAKNGLEAVNLSKANEYNLILMDLQMPEMDGYSASKAIKALEGEYYQNLPIIALTASAMLDSKDKVYNCGMVDFVTKPFNPAELQAKIHKHLKINSNRTVV